jgi:hypothetical protein
VPLQLRIRKFGICQPCDHCCQHNLKGEQITALNKHWMFTGCSLDVH